MKKLLTACVITGLQAFTPAVFAHVPEEGYPAGPCMMLWRYGAGWWMFPLVMIVVMLIFGFLFIRRRGWRSSWCGFGEQKGAETPLDILKRRYVKGEISKEEFEAIKKDL